MAWVSALFLLILFLGADEASRRIRAAEDYSAHGNPRNWFEESLKEGESYTDMEEDAEEQVLIEFLRNLDEESAAHFMQELDKWLELASSSSCFNLAQFFVSGKSSEDHKTSKRMGFTGAAEGDELDTRNEIDELFGGDHRSGSNCGAALLIGRRPTQEDRVLCLPDLILPSLGGGSSSISRTMGFFGVFDGHMGEEASDFVSKCLHQYFLHQVYIITGSLIAHIFSIDFSFEPSLSKMAARISWPKTVDLKDFRSLFEGKFGLNPQTTNTNPEIQSKVPLDETDVNAKHPFSLTCTKHLCKELTFSRNFLPNEKSIIDEDSCSDNKALQSGSCLVAEVSQPHPVETKLLGEKVNDSPTQGFSETFRQKCGELCRRSNLGMDNKKVYSLDKSCSIIQESSFEADSQISSICENCFYRTLYKKALSNAIFTVDLAFDEEAKKKGWDGGTTACVALIMDGHVLISNLGDSKAYFCSVPCKSTSVKDANLVTRRKRLPRHTLHQHIIKSTSKSTDIAIGAHKGGVCVQELTQDHHPDRRDERVRIEAAGGFVEEWGGVPRVNGVLAVSRSIGDLPFKRYGVICTPEYTGWMPIGSTYSYLLIASDGVFERLETQDTCRLISAQALLHDEESKLSWASKMSAMKQLERYEDSSYSLDPNFVTAELPIPLPPKQQEVSTEDGNLLKIGGKNMSEEIRWGATVNSSGLSEKKPSEIGLRESIKDIEALKALLSKDRRRGTQNLGSCDIYRLNYEGSYDDKSGTDNDPMTGKSSQLDVSDPSSIAQMIVEMAHALGSQDNLAAVVIPLESQQFQLPPTSVEHPCYSSEVVSGRTFDHEHTSKLVTAGHFNSSETNKLSYSMLNKSMTSIQNSFATQLDLKVKEGKSEGDVFPIVLRTGMLVENQCHGCYELMERLSGDMVLPLRDGLEAEFPTEDNPLVEEGSFDSKEKRNWISMHLGESNKQIQVYEDHQLWAHKILQTEAERDKRVKATSACQLLSLVGSLQPDPQTLSTSQLDEPPSYVVQHKRYILKKNVAHGSFGEIWLALRKSCSSKENVKAFKTRSIDEDLDATFESNSSSNKSSFQCEGRMTWIYNISPSVEGVQKSSADDVYILKRILMKGDSGVSLSGLREKYFGEIFMNASLQQVEQAKKTLTKPPQKFGFCSVSKQHSQKMNLHSPYPVTKNFSYYASEQQLKDLSNCTRDDRSIRIKKEEGLNHIARFVDSFEIQHQGELWLVFKMEGKSLSSLLYDSEGTIGHPGDFLSFKVLEPSSWWRWLKTTKAGHEEYRNLLKQLMLGLQTCHRYNITHRDIKPENMVVHASGSQYLSGINSPYNLTLRLIDFGSALDPFTTEHLYGSTGPSEKEQTIEYSPPEALLWKHWLHLHYNQAHAYDMWSVGVVMLELVLGTPHVFQVSSRTHALLDRHLEEWDEASKKTAYMLRAFMEMCIFLPGVRPHHYRAEPFSYSEKFGLASWDCTEEALLQQIKQRDPLRIGMPDVWSLRLLRQLLQWYPEDRISAEDALEHPFFHPSRQATTNSK